MKRTCKIAPNSLATVATSSGRTCTTVDARRSERTGSVKQESTRRATGKHTGLIVLLLEITVSVLPIDGHPRQDAEAQKRKARTQRTEPVEERDSQGPVPEAH